MHAKWVPFDVSCEQQLLGAVLLNNEAYGLVQEMVGADHFHEPVHRELFAICASLIQMGKLASPTTVRSFLTADAEIVPGMTKSQYLARLAAEATTIVNARDFAQVIRDLYDQRVIGEVGLSLQPQAGVDPVQQAAWGVDQLDAIASSRTVASIRAMTIGQSVIRAVDAAAHAFQNEGKMLGIPYGLADLDGKTLGAQRGHLIIIAARPSMGKSALALAFARSMASAGYHGGMFSLEMGDVELTQRMIADEMFDDGRMTYWQIRSGRFHESVFRRIQEAGERLTAMPFWIEPQPALSVAQIGARARQRKRRGRLDFMIVDHLGLIPSTGRYSNKTNEVGETTSALKALAKELDVPIFLLVQLNRGLESRDDKRPRMSDMRDSGNIEEDADVVLMLYRKAYYLERSEPPQGSAEHLVWQEQLETCIHELQIGIEKQRAGPVGIVKVFCDIGANAIRSLARPSGGEMMG